MTASPILDLAGVTLEVNHLARGVRFYVQVLGLTLVRHDPSLGVAELAVNPHQSLTLWQPITRVQPDPRLARLGARGAAHLHYAWQVLPGALPGCREVLEAQGVAYQDINLGTEEKPDWGVYFFDPFGHGLELREVDPGDARQPLFSPSFIERPPHALPVVGLREAALAFFDYAAMKERLPRAYGLALFKEQAGRDFAQFTLAREAAEDGNGTPQRWLYAWDPQVGLADMLGGDHATLRFYADVETVAGLVEKAGLDHIYDDLGLAVRDPEGHVFEFVSSSSASR